MLECYDSNAKARFQMLVSKSDVSAYLSAAASSGFAAYDYETSCLSHKRGYVVGTSFCASDDLAIYIPLRHTFGVNAEPGVFELVRDFIEAIPLVAHNFSFEYKWTRSHFGRIPRILTDTQLAIWVYNSDNCRNFSGLKDFVRRHYGYKMVDFEEVTRGSKDFTKVSSEDGYFYGASDSLWTWRIKRDIEAEIRKESGLSNIYDLERSVLPIVCEMVYYGIRTNVDLLNEFKTEQQASYDAALASLSECTLETVPGITCQTDLYGKNVLSVNFDSHSDILKILKALGISVTSTNKKEMAALKGKHPIIELIQNYRKQSTMLSSFIEPYYRYLEDDNIIHPDLIQGGAPTGRFACKDPNFLAMPKIRD